MFCFSYSLSWVFKNVYIRVCKFERAWSGGGCKWLCCEEAAWLWDFRFSLWAWNTKQCWQCFRWLRGNRTSYATRQQDVSGWCSNLPCFELLRDLANWDANMNSSVPNNVSQLVNTFWPKTMVSYILIISPWQDAMVIIEDMFLRVSTHQKYNTSGPSEFFISALFVLICESAFLELFKEQKNLII